MSRTNKPIWQDTIVTETGVSLQHLVNDAWQDTGMRIMPVPAGYEPEAAINRFVEDDLKSTKPEFVGETAITVQPYAYQVYKFSGETSEYGFLNDWSYEEWTGDTRCLSAPINRHADSRQRLVYGNFSETGNSIIVKELIRPVITITPRIINVGAEQTTAYIEITSNIPYELSTDSNWFTINPTSGSAGSQMIYIGISESHDFDDRQAIITMEYEKYWDPDMETITACTIVQSAIVPSYNVSPLEQGITWDTSDLVIFVVNTNVPFTASTEASWLTYSGQSQAGYHSYNVYFSASTNSGYSREDYVSFTFQVDATGGTQTIMPVVRQLAFPGVTKRIYYTASPAQILTPNTTEGFGAVYVGSYHEGSDYFWAFETEPTALPDSVCAGLTPLRSVTAPNTVISIGTSAFTQTNISAITALGVTTIGAYAFNGDKVLQNADFDSLTYVGECAFQNCSALTSIDLSNIAYLGEYAFNKCEVLQNVELGSDLRYVPRSCFAYCSGITSMDIPEGVTGMSSEVFECCYNLSSVTLPNTLIEFGKENRSNGTFYRAYGLSSLTIPDSVVRIYGEIAYGNGAITALTIPDSVEHLDTAYLDHFKGLKELTIGARVIPVACMNISTVSSPTPSSITITTAVTEILSAAFSSPNFSAATVNYTGTKAQWAQVIKGAEWAICGTIVHCTDGDVSVNEPVMRYVSSNGSYAGPHNTTSLYCLNVDSVGNKTYVISTISEPWNIPNNAFSGYTNLQSIEMINISSIGLYVFSGCTNLKSIIFSDNLTEIPQLCCYECSALSSITLGSNLQTIGADSFRGCTHLTNITFEGSISQWSLITKGANWSYQVPATVVHCSDGDTPL